MPVYNEQGTVLAAIARVLNVDYPCPVELIVVDDGSRDSTRQLLDTIDSRQVRVLRHPRNVGKGAAVRTGVEQARGSHVLILDADLEYAPADIPALMMPVLRGDADHVFGTRVMGLNCRFPSFRYALGGRFTTLVANVLYDSCLTDMHSCLKLVPSAQFQSFALRENGFGLDTELTARLLRGGVRPYEVPISYIGRNFDEGKKITWRDGIKCLAILARVRTERHPQPVVDVAHERMSDLFLIHGQGEVDGTNEALVLQSPATA